MMKIKGWSSVVLFACIALWIIFPQHASAKDPTGKYVVVIDPAHGGKDEGVQLSRNVSEKDITLAVATLIKRNLEDSKNLVVRFTRMGDTDVPLADRVGAAIKANADLFISLHVNAGFEKESTGYELYFPGFKGQEGVEGGPEGRVRRDRPGHGPDELPQRKRAIRPDPPEQARPGVSPHGQGSARRPGSDSSKPQHPRRRPGDRVCDQRQ